MEQVNNIVDYIILKFKADEDAPLINLKLQKLLYYTQAWYLAFYEHPLFEDDFEAWVHGPVCKEVYNRFRDSKSLYSMINVTDVINNRVNRILPEDIMEHIDSVIEVYGGFSGTELENMTHNEKPWQNARVGYSPFQRCEVIIRKVEMQDYYKGRLS